MGHEANIWGTEKDASIEDAITQVMERRQVIRVDQVELESGRVFRAQDGMVLEVILDPSDTAKDCVRIAKVGTTVHAYIEKALVVHAGELTATAAEAAAELIKVDRERAAEAEVETVLQALIASMEPANIPSNCSVCAGELDVRKYVAKLSCGSLLCKRCAHSQPSAAAE